MKSPADKDAVPNEITALREYTVQNATTNNSALAAALELLQGTYARGEITLHVEVSPCSWMYPNYGFQVHYTDTRPDGDHRSWGHVHDKQKHWSEVDRDDVQRMLDTLPVKPCRDCQTPHLFNPESNRADQCEQCFMGDLNKEFEKHSAKEAARQARMDQKRIKQGFTHRIDAWIHPARGGDDYVLQMYSKGAMTETAIKRAIAKERSSRSDDYTVTELVVNAQSTH